MGQIVGRLVIDPMSVPFIYETLAVQLIDKVIRGLHAQDPVF